MFRTTEAATSKLEPLVGLGPAILHVAEPFVRRSLRSITNGVPKRWSVGTPCSHLQIPRHSPSGEGNEGVPSYAAKIGRPAIGGVYWAGKTSRISTIVQTLLLARMEFPSSRPNRGVALALALPVL